jgi:tetratricopeptide (TPR) repeat protein
MTHQARTDPAGFPPSHGGITVLESPGANPVEDRFAASAIRPEALVGAILQAANTHYGRNNVAAACDFLSLLDHCNAHTPETLETLGNLRFLQREYGPAAAAYQRALTQAPAHAGLWLSLALTSRELKDFQTLQSSLGRALDLETGNPQALKFLADELRDQGHCQDAAHIYGGLVQRDPSNIDVCLSLAKCFFESGDLATTESTLRHVLEVDPENAAAREALSALRTEVAAPADKNLGWNGLSGGRGGVDA